MVLKTLNEGMTPVILGGDHSVAAGSVSGVAEFYRKQNQKIGLIWIDAHTDINTPATSPSGNVHGMPLAALGGRAEVMDLLAPTGPVYQAGTLSGNPLATIAGLKGMFGYRLLRVLTSSSDRMAGTCFTAPK